jgi:hypothetical protein
MARLYADAAKAAVRAILKKGRSGVAIPLEFRCFTDIIVAVSHGNHVMA